MSSQTSQLFVPPQADALIRGQRKIEAIREVLDANPGASLRAAKEAVEARERALDAGAMPMPAPAPAVAAAPEGLPPEAVEAVRQGRLIEAIEHVRSAHGVDLRTAKQRIEAYARGESAGAAPAHLPADVVALLHAGDRGGAWQLLEREHGATSAEALRRIADYETARKRRGLGGGVGATVARGDDGGRWTLWALLAAVVALAVWWVLR